MGGAHTIYLYMYNDNKELFCISLHWDCLQWWQTLVFQWGRCGKHHHTASTKSSAFPHLHCTLTLRSNCCGQKLLHMFRFQRMCCRRQCHWAWQWIAVIAGLRAHKCWNITNMKYYQLHQFNMHVYWQSSYKGYRKVSIAIKHKHVRRSLYFASCCLRMQKKCFFSHFFTLLRLLFCGSKSYQQTCNSRSRIKSLKWSKKDVFVIHYRVIFSVC